MLPANKTARWIVLGNLGMFLLVANWITYAKEDLLSSGRSVLLAIEPADPRSLMQGDFMALHYPVSALIDQRVAEKARGEGLVVIAIDQDDVGHFARLHQGEELATDEALLLYRIRVGRRNRARVAAEEFFFQEGMAEEFGKARYAELRLAADGQTLLVGLRDSERKLIGRGKN